jgi:hypothetical protein
MKAVAIETLYTTVDDQLYDELNELTDQKIVYVELWEDSLADVLGQVDGRTEDSEQFDLDLYLEEGVYLELYGVQCFSDPDDEPWQGLEFVRRQVLAQLKRGLWLEEVAVDETEGLVLVLGRGGQPYIYLDVGGWQIEEWDELPDA